MKSGRVRAPLSSLSPNLVSSNNNHEVQWISSSEKYNEIMEDVGVQPLNTSSSDNENDTENCMFQKSKYRRIMKSHIVKKTKSKPSLNSVKNVKINNFTVVKRSASCNCHFSKLPNELILHIFKWLPMRTLAACSLVCKRWNIISCDDSLWRKYNGGGKKHFAPGVVGTLVKRGVIALRLVEADIESPIFIDSFKPTPKFRFSKLKYLDLSFATISEVGLFEILSVCASLRCLSLENCKINEMILNNVAENNKLEQLNMTMCRGITGQSIVQIAQCCLNLKSWNLGWTDMGNAGIDALAQKLPPMLERLCISGYRNQLVDKKLKAILNQCPCLKELDISDDAQLSGVISYIVHQLPELETLHCSRCYNIAPNSYIQLEELKCFQSLNSFSVMTENALKCLRGTLSHIAINEQRFSTIARPTTGDRKTSIWGVTTRENVL